METLRRQAKRLIARPGRTAWIVWGVLCLAAWTLIALSPDRHPVNESYANGARAWRNRERLYTGGGTLFIYPPQAAILHLPFLTLPKLPYELAWRIVTIGLFAAGVHRLIRCAERVAVTERFELRGQATFAPPTPPLPPRGGEGAGNAPVGRNSSVIERNTGLVTLAPGALFLLTTIIAVPKTWTVAINGQATPAMAGLMLLALADISERRWWRAAGALVLALSFKPLTIILILLVAALSWHMLWRLAVGCAFFFALPYLTRDAAYVTNQYAAFVDNLNDAALLGKATAWPQLFSLLHGAGLDLSESGKTALQLVAAALTFAAGWHVRRRFPAHQGAILLYSLAACYLLLFNPRTENNSYTLLMPAVAALAARAFLVERRLPRAILLTGIAAVLTGGYEISGGLTPAADFVWPCPLACLVFLGFLVAEIATNQAWDRLPLTRTASQVIQPTELQCSM